MTQAAQSPDAWSRRLRRAAGPLVVATRRLDASRRARPDFVLVGAQKSGTSTLYARLTAHPSVVPALRKEVHYFDAAPRSESWYRAFFPRQTALSAVATRTGAGLTGEATPFYLLHPAAPPRLQAALPDAKIIAILREPAARAISGYHHAVRMGHEARPIDVALDPGAEEPLANVADATWFDAPECPARLRGYLARSRYAEQLERWFAAFPREHILVLETEQLDAETAVPAALQFLGLPVDGPLEAPDRNVGAYAASPSAIETRLREYFAPHNERLFTLLGTRWPWPTA